MFSNCKLIHRLFSAYLSLQIGKGIVGVSCLWFIFFTEKCLLEIAYLFNYIDSFGRWNEKNCNEWVSVCAKHLSLFSFRNTTITMSMKWKINDIRISSCCDLNYIRMVCKKICTIPILYLYSNNLVFDVGVQLQDICFPRP